MFENLFPVAASADVGSGCGDNDQGGCDGHELFVVAHKPSVLDDPREHLLDDSAAGRTSEPFMQTLRWTSCIVMCVFCLVQSTRRPAWPLLQVTCVTSGSRTRKCLNTTLTPSQSWISAPRLFEAIGHALDTVLILISAVAQAMSSLQFTWAGSLEGCPSPGAHCGPHHHHSSCEPIYASDW